MPTIIAPDDAAWRALRRMYGGSSEAAALFDRGYQNMPSAWSLFALKTGALPEIDYGDDDQRIRIGRRMEAVIAAEVHHVTGWDIIDNTETATGERVYITHPNKDLRMGCTVDRWVREHEDGPGIIECKNRDYLEWVDAYTDDDASIRDRIQLAHQLACQPEIAWGMIAVIVGGNDLKRYVYKRADLAAIIADVEDRWRWFWQLVDAGQEPELTGGELPGWLQAHDVILAGTTRMEPMRLDADGTAGFDDIVAAYLSSDGQAKQHAKVAEAAKAKIVQALDEHPAGRSNRYRIRATYSPVAESVVTLPPNLKCACLEASTLLNDSEFADDLYNAAEWSVVTRKASVRTLLKIELDPMDVQGVSDYPTLDPGNGQPRPPQPSSAELMKRAFDFQKPLGE